MTPNNKIGSYSSTIDLTTIPLHTVVPADFNVPQSQRLALLVPKDVARQIHYEEVAAHVEQARPTMQGELAFEVMKALYVEIFPDKRDASPNFVRVETGVVARIIREKRLQNGLHHFPGTRPAERLRALTHFIAENEEDLFLRAQKLYSQD